jgi:preprotein translocase subunit SecG
MLGGVQKQLTFLDKSTWTLATILIALFILLSRTLSDTDSKIIENTGVQHQLQTPVAPATKHTCTTNQQNKFLQYLKCQS